MKNIITSIFLLAFVMMTNAQSQAPEAVQATAGTLTVTFSTSSTSKFAAAIYITNSAGSLVNTMLYRTSNGDNSAQDMLTYWSKIGSSWSTSPTILLTNTDAVTGATSSTGYTAQQIFWGKKSSISTVADGTYTVNFEMANYSPLNRRYTSSTFVKGATPTSTSVTAITGFTGMTIAWAPVNTEISDVEFEKLYNVYPTKATSSIYITGTQIKDVQICSLNGKVIYTTKETSVNISTLPKGNYLAVIYAKDGRVVRKFQKI